MRLTLLPIILLVSSLNAHHQRLNSGLANSNSGTQYVPTEREYNTMVYCFSQFTAFYGFNMVDNKLPSSQSAFVTQVMLNSPTICRNFQELNKCMGRRYKELVDFDSLVNLTLSAADAYYYLKQTSMAEFFCGDSLPFVLYAECMERVSMSSEETSFDECNGIDWNSCQNVAASLDCKASIIHSSCGLPSVYSAFCEYQGIQLRMTGWNACANVRCLSCGLSLFNTFIVALIFSPYL